MLKEKLRGVQQARVGRYLGQWVVDRVRPRVRGRDREGRERVVIGFKIELCLGKFYSY